MTRMILSTVACMTLAAAAMAQQQRQQQAPQTGQTAQQGAQQLLTPQQPPAPPAQPAGGNGLPAAPALIPPPRPIEAGDRIVELAICLDTSGSMEGLINAARVKLWEIVNDLALAKPTPRLRVALLTYGNDGHNAENGWVNIDIGFTEDLDMVSKQLFALTTNGGTELVGRVLKAAGERLDWNASDDVLKLIVVAGNESADQDTTFNFRDVCKATISKGVMI
ncbi:MAG TPA: vWA domain-containing protein, partial [Phycisphaerales bacterium]|nr:vWA domain-containing protein [Phycisphaerales bacterium]